MNCFELILFNFSGSTPLSSGASSGGGGGPVILELPLDKIRRPLMRTRSNDPNKVQELMDSIQEIGLQVPVRTAKCPKLLNLQCWVLYFLFGILESEEKIICFAHDLF